MVKRDGNQSGGRKGPSPGGHPSRGGVTVGGGTRTPPKVYRSPTPRATAPPRSSAPSRPAPRTQPGPYRGKERKRVARHKRTRSYYNDYRAAWERNPHMREIHDILVESAKLAATDGDNTPRALAERSKHLYDLAHDMLEKERRRGPDRIAIDAYLHYVDDLWERAKPFYGGAKPGARISDEERGDALAWVKSSDHDNVDYTRRLARDFMDDPAGIPGSVFEYVRPLASSRQAHHASQAALRRNVKATKRHGRAQAKSVPLHEWAHVKQFRSGTFPDLEQWEYEGGAEALAQMLEGSVAGVKTGRVYGPYVRRVNRERGPEWVTHGQFGEVAPARSLASVADEHGLRPLVTQKFVRRKKYKKRIG